MTKNRPEYIGAVVLGFAALAGCVEDPGHQQESGDDEDKSATIMTAAEVPKLGDSFANCWVESADGFPQLWCQRVGAAFASYKPNVTVSCDGVSKLLPAEKTTPVGVCGLLGKTSDVAVTLTLSMPPLSSSTGFYWSGSGLYDAVKTTLTLNADNSFANADNPSMESPASLDWPFMTWHLLLNNSMPAATDGFVIKVAAPDITYADVTSASGDVAIRGSELRPNVTWVPNPESPNGGKMKQFAPQIEAFIIGAPSGVPAELLEGRTKLADYSFTKSGVYDVSAAGIVFVSDIPAE